MLNIITLTKLKLSFRSQIKVQNVKLSSSGFQWWAPRDLKNRWVKGSKPLFGWSPVTPESAPLLHLLCHSFQGAILPLQSLYSFQLKTLSRPIRSELKLLKIPKNQLEPNPGTKQVKRNPDKIRLANPDPLRLDGQNLKNSKSLHILIQLSLLIIIKIHFYFN